MPDSRQPPYPSRRTFRQSTNDHINYDDPPASGLEPSSSSARQTTLQRMTDPDQDLIPSVSDFLAATRRERSLRRQSLLGSMPRRRPRSSSTDDRDGRETSDADVTGIEAERLGRRSKRRKTQHLGSLPKQKDAIKYGYYGQVESGRLKLDLVSCDGGEHQDRRHPSISLGPENVLRLDKSVYSSERSSSNLLLQHADERPFCLEKLHIVGPEHGFTAPVREGLVYVAMTMQDLQPYLDPPIFARRSGFDTPPYRRAARTLGGQPGTSSRSRMRVSRNSDTGLTLQEALQDPYINDEVENRRHERQDFARRADEAHDLASSNDGNEDNAYLNAEDLSDEYGQGYYCDPSERFDARGLQNTQNDYDYENNRERPPTQPVTLLSDDDFNFEDTSSREILDFRLERMSTVRTPRYEAEWDDEIGRSARIRDIPPPPPPAVDDEDDEISLPTSRFDRIDYLMGRSHQRSLEASSREHTNGGNHHANVMGGKQVTVARFQIRRTKHKVAIKFDPPVSGRFVLLKVWSTGKGNVDVQAVVAKGYGGCRFFPAVQVR